MLHRLILPLALALSGALAGAAQAAEPLPTATAEYLELPREVRLEGVVEAVNKSTISAQTSGQVDEVLVDVDDFVKQGDVIARLRDTEHRARLTQALAEQKAAEAALQNAGDEYQRIKGVFERKLVSASDMDKASSTLASAKAKRDAAAAAIDQLTAQLDYTVIRAPYSGIVTKRYVEVGEMANPGQPVMDGISLDELRVNVEVPQSMIPAVRERMKASVQQPGDGYLPVERITIFPIANHGSNTFKVRLDLPKGTPNLVPGMYVNTAFEVGTGRALLIPIAAVARRSELTGVYVIGAEGRIGLRQVRLGSLTGDRQVVILAGREAGEQVAMDPAAATAALKAQAPAAAATKE